MSFIDELKRRNVFKVAIAYAIVAWLIAQVTELALDSFSAPDWVMKTVLLLLVLGFPLALLLAWAFELTPDGIKRDNQAHPEPAQATAAPGQITSIAVLPLDNLGKDPEQEYFADGMTETLITELSKIGALRVTSRQSIMQFKGANESLPDIARKLNVQAVVEGSALLVGGQVRITVQLIDAASDQHLWADNYDRDLGDVLAIHSEVACSIAREIHIAVTPEEATLLARARVADSEAYRLWLKGNFQLHKETEESYGTGVHLSRK